MRAKISIPYAEQEMVINYTPDMGKECEIYTTIPWMMKHLETMVEKYPDIYILVKDDQYSYTVRLPYKLIKPRAPKVMTEEEKTVLATRLAEARKKNGRT